MDFFGRYVLTSSLHICSEACPVVFSSLRYLLLWQQPPHTLGFTASHLSCGPEVGVSLGVTQTHFSSWGAAWRQVPAVFCEGLCRKELAPDSCVASTRSQGLVGSRANRVPCSFTSKGGGKGEKRTKMEREGRVRGGSASQDRSRHDVILGLLHFSTYRSLC